MARNNPDDLIGTIGVPPYVANTQAIAGAGRAYFNLTPYPRFGFKDWKTEDQGKIPRCLAFPRNITVQGAEWLWGQPIQFTPGDEKWKEQAERANEIWAYRSMGSVMTRQAEIAGQIGGVLAKFNYNPDDERCSWNFDFYDPSVTARIFFDAEQEDGVAMIRLQWPYFDPYEKPAGCWMWHREDWTPTHVQEYVPHKSITQIAQISYAYTDLPVIDVASDWEKQGGPRKNEYGLLPFQLIKNREGDSPIGVGDMWPILHLADQVNFTADLEHKHNQLAVFGHLFTIDAKENIEDDPQPMAPGGATALESDGEHKGDVKLIEASGEVRPFVRQQKLDVFKEIFDATGAVLTEKGEITNKGNLTVAVFTMIFEPLIKTTNRKRELQGENGVCKLFEKMAKAASNMGLKSEPLACKDVDFDLIIKWPPYFEESEEEKLARAQRLQTLMESGLLPPEEAAQEYVASEPNISNADDFMSSWKLNQAKMEADAKRELAATTKAQGPTPKGKGN